MTTKQGVHEEEKKTQRKKKKRENDLPFSSSKLAKPSYKDRKRFPSKFFFFLFLIEHFFLFYCLYVGTFKKIEGKKNEKQ